MPGPVLKARKGDTLVVSFTNSLGEPTTIHWHGLRIPSLMDGTEDVQKPVQPGETFEYRFVLPDAGTYWYHPHFNEPTQLERGLYGALVVEDPNDPTVDADRLFLIDDMKLTKGNKFKQPGWFLARWMERHDGREGETLLINGKEQPVIEVNAGQQERWRFANTSSARYILLHLGGEPFQVIGTDGGLLEKPYSVTEVLVTPGERYDVIAGPFEVGETLAIEALPFNRGPKESERLKLATISVGDRKPSIAFIPENLRLIEPLASQDTSANKTI
ncbi:multicopper oxidase family protein [Aliifodinibius sp. S!AR15-10]|uniref:multicopper oxidase family protein n=1 Tax=Aliifodinibius sp. S!AR15-10 TaxID=2950437 RepID=UPI0028562C6E|nr:multicopper oxidase family protein [Aliifodinibius sp. S!AR15-10]MDR8389820.1 multicopper oxidase family protein [Aliifodinibius sp. S!AR15-10]